jgi:uncharacterized protein YqgC (DUF456 family)
MTLWTTLAVALLALALAAGWLLTLLGLPGNWLIVLAAAAYSVWGPEEARPEMSLWTPLALLGLAVVGEVLEFALGAVAAKRAGGSRRAALGTLAGGLAGAVAGMFVGVPIPIVGPLIAAVLFAALGAMAGALAAQKSHRNLAEAQKAWRIGKAAFWGRLGGTAAKIVVATLMVLLSLAALFVE